VISTTYTIVENERIYGLYQIMINGTWITLESDAQWRTVYLNQTGGGGSSGLKQALQDLVNLPEWGDCPDGYTLNSTGDKKCYDSAGNMKVRSNTSDFNKIVMFFIFLAVVIAILNFYTGYDTAYPGSLIYITTLIVLVLSIVNGPMGPGFFYMEGATNLGGEGSVWNQVLNNYILVMHFMMLSGIYFLTTLRRYQS
jgi:hypothetical protein